MRVKAIIIRIIKQTIHDKRTLALMMVAPMIVMTLVYFLFNSNEENLLNVGVYNTSSEFNESLKDADLNIKEYSDKNNIKNKKEIFKIKKRSSIRNSSFRNCTIYNAIYREYSFNKFKQSTS